MCQTTVYLSHDGREEEVMKDVIWLELSPEGVKMASLFEEPKVLQAARIERIDLLNNTITLVPREREQKVHWRGEYK